MLLDNYKEMPIDKVAVRLAHLIKDMEDFKQKVQKQTKLKNKAIKEFKKYFDIETTGIESAAASVTNKKGHIYNLSGQIVDSNYRGIVIKDGHKYIQK